MTSQLTAIAFNDKYQAERLLGMLGQLEKDRLVRIDEALVIVRDENGKFRRSHGLDDTLPGVVVAAGGAGLGLLVGAAVTLPVIGLVAGGIMAHRLASSNQLIRRVRQFIGTLEPGMSALFVTGDTDDVEQLIDRLKSYLIGAIFLQTDLPDDLLVELHNVAQDSIASTNGTKFKRVLAIINPAAGIERPILKPLNHVLRSAGIAWDIAITHASGDAKHFAREAVDAGYDAVMIYGGDGSVMEAASGLRGSGIPLAIIPGGTGNVMSIELGIENDVTQAAELLTRENISLREIDMGQVGDNYFVLRVATGYEAEFVKGTSREAKERLGSLAYTLTAIKQGLALVRYTLILDGNTVEVDGYTCMVANSGNIGVAGMPLLSRINISDGLLDVVVVQNLNFFSLLQQPGTRNEQAVQDRMVQRWQVREVTVETQNPQTVVGDGEVWGETPFSAKVLPGAVRVIVP